MVIACITAKALLLLSPRHSFLSAADPQGETGNNGYPDYVRAGKLLTDSDFNVYEAWSPDRAPDADGDPAKVALARRLAQMSFLQVKREEVEKFGAVLDVVRAGSQLPVFDPRPNLSPTITLPEMASFKSICRLFSADSYVRFADGDSTGGTRSFMDGLVFSYKISGGSLISALVGVAGSSIMFRPFAARLPGLSVVDCEHIQSIAELALSAPMGMVSALEAERKMAIKTVTDALREGKSLASLTDTFSYLGRSSDDRPSKEALDAFAKIQPGDYPKYSSEVESAFNDFYRGLANKLKGGEAQWFGAGDDKALLQRQYSPVTAVLMEVMLPAFDQVLAAVAKQRTQFRLLALHGKILEYKWQHNRLPGKLSDAVAEPSRQDPLTGQEFTYVRKEERYRLYSRGVKATGEIELAYRVTALDAGSNAGPP